MPGPVPKHPDSRARKNRTVGMTWLPAAGREGRAPRWPLPVDIALVVKLEAAERAVERYEHALAIATPAKKRAAAANVEKAQLRVDEFKGLIRARDQIEKQLWREIWKTPQATQWEKLKWTRDIAQYVRHKARAETGSAEDAREARQWADRLGLTPLSLLRLRWEISEAVVVEIRTGELPGDRARGRYKHLRSTVFTGAENSAPLVSGPTESESGRPGRGKNGA